MSLDGMFVHRLTVQRATPTTDRYGNTVGSWTSPATEEVYGWVTQTAASEIVDQRDAQVSEWVGYLPAGTDIVGSDRLVWSKDDDYDTEITFEIVGPPHRAHHPRSGEHHVEVKLRVVAG